ncbi:hypothetical protein [Chromobacterium amazonense]|uniref:hypothetical protein n=1 Tax=Chromobacterium amazonense TaxID=1382803 RepID=UPI0031F69187
MKKPDYCPAWFDLANYEPCRSFSPTAWKMAIFERSHALKCVKDSEEAKITCWEPEYDIPQLSKERNIELAELDESDFVENNDYHVKDMDAWNFFAVYSCLPEDVIEYAQKNCDDPSRWAEHPKSFTSLSDWRCCTNPEQGEAPLSPNGFTPQPPYKRRPPTFSSREL